MKRRDFVKAMGTSMLLASVGCARRPVEKIIPYVHQPEEIIPGVANWYTSTCQECPASCGMLVKTREGRPIKLEGNQSHPLSQGGLCARGQASLFNLYDPGRLKGPMGVDRATQQTVILTWSQVDASMREKLAKIKQQDQSVYFLTGHSGSPSTYQLISDFLKTFNDGKHVVYNSMIPADIARAQEVSYGQDIIPRYRFDKAQYILSFGADFLGTWISPVEFAKGFSKAKRVQEEKLPVRFVCFESTLTLTGTNADEYIPIRPGDELMIALALAYALIIEKEESEYTPEVEIRRALAPYSVSVVSSKTGVPESVIRRIAQELWMAREQGLVLGGAVNGKHALALEVVANLLNSLLQNDGVTIDWAYSYSTQAKSSQADLVELIDHMNQGRVGALFIDQINPVYSLPPQLEFEKAILKVPLVVNFSNQLCDTALKSTYVCPSGHYLENWNDANPQRKVWSLVQPAIVPLYDTRSFQDSILQWGNLSYQNWYDYLRAYWQQNVYPLRSLAPGTSLAGSKPRGLPRNLGSRASPGIHTIDRLTVFPGSFDNFWDHVLETGYLDAREYQTNEPERLVPSRQFIQSSLKYIPQPQHVSKDVALLSLYPSVNIYDGNQSRNAWLQALPDPVSKISWGNYLSVSPQTALKYSFQEGEVVEVEGDSFKTFELPIHLQPKMSENHLILALGYGQSDALIPSYLDVQGNFNAYQLQTVDKDTVEWTGLVVRSLKKTGKHESFAPFNRDALMLGDPLEEENFQRIFSGIKTMVAHAHHPLYQLPKDPLEGHRWGMVIDTQLCIGCQACSISCQTENNSPFMSRKQLVKNAAMNWLTIDRYYKGNKENPDVIYQPMLCQHCEEAPCEPACPVAALVHDAEGVHQMVYKRCVGAEKCARKCPYPVLHFNRENYTKASMAPLHLMLNPDITVRSIGVMEKCSFCVQRIQEARFKAQDEGRGLQEGDVKTACQQSCPTNAIVFGDLNDPKSLVSQLIQEKRAYHLLPRKNTRPRITYLGVMGNG